MNWKPASFLALFTILHPLASKAHPFGYEARAASSNTQNTTSYHANAGVLRFVNPLIGTQGPTPNDNGGMIPSVGVPFGMTRWTPQTRENYISQVPYSDGDSFIHGFQATHQPAIWMGESGQVVLAPGWDTLESGVKPRFEHRGLRFRKEEEVSTPYVYEVLLDGWPTGTQNWNSTEEAVGGGEVPGGAGNAPDDVKKGANGRVRRGIGERATGPELTESIERGIQVRHSLARFWYHCQFFFLPQGL